MRTDFPIETIAVHPKVVGGVAVTNEPWHLCHDEFTVVEGWVLGVGNKSPRALLTRRL